MSFSEIYYGCGIAFESDLELPGIPVSAVRLPQVHVRLGSIPSSDEIQLTAENWYHAVPGRLQFLVPDVGRFLVSNGTDILVDPATCASESDVRLFLLGSAFGALLHQRGVLPLHASTVRVGNHYAAFLGNSGDGKSTQAAVLHQAGYSHAGDDICPVTPDGDDAACADLGFTRMKLWEDTIRFLQIDQRGLQRSDFDRNKYDVPTCRLAGRERRPLSAVYVLEYIEDGEQPGIERVTGQSCLPLLLQHTYRYCFVEPLDVTERHFCLCLDVARTVPIFRLRRRPGTEYLDETTDMLKQHWNRLDLLKSANVA